MFLVHGFWDKYRLFHKMARHLRSKGHHVFYELNLLPNTGKYGIEHLALQLQKFIDLHAKPDQKIHIVAFSMGGIVARYYIQKLSTASNVNKLITIATPHFGTHAAKIFNYKACVEMRPNSLFLRELNSDLAKLSSIEITSIWAKYDSTILPNTSSKLPIGNEIVLPFGIHPFLPRYRSVILEIEKALNN